MTGGTDTHVPLCVDCDGTLVRTDLLHESTFALLRTSVLQFLLLPLWMLRGKAFLKQQLAARVSLDASVLPYNTELVEFIRNERAHGRQIVLATASPRPFATAVADYLGLFDRIEATDARENLAGPAKAKRLLDIFGERGFDYVGNSRADLPIWRVSRQALVVQRGAPSLEAQIKSTTPVQKVFSLPAAKLTEYAKGLRLHQWLKNALVFVPLLAAHRVTDSHLLWLCIVAFVAFGICASSVYVLNDLLDLPADRRHRSKRLRPFAAGTIPIWHGAIIVPVLTVVAALLATAVSSPFIVMLGAYLVLTLAYSLLLKQLVVVDVMTLAALYTTRILAGAAATGIPPSFWLLALSMFIFLSLAIVKRYSELKVVFAEQHSQAAGRGYRVDDMPLLQSVGVGCGLLSVLVFALYVNGPDVGVLYASRAWLWLAPPLLLYWIVRVWMKTHRGEMNDDPVIFAIKDGQSRVIAVAFAVIATLATTGSSAHLLDLISR